MRTYMRTMRKNIVYIIVSCLGLAIFLSLSGHAAAALGGAVDTVEGDQNALSAHRRIITSYAGYTVQEISSDSVSVREYVSPSGVVFGIAWDGLIHPDLTKLLGNYAGEYENARKLMRRVYGQKRLMVKTDQVVVEKWGHMRNLHGRAYAPSLLPPGVNVNDIK